MDDDIVFADWRTSSLSFSNGNCVEASAWRKSSRSNGHSMCVEAGSCSHGVAVRDTRDRGGPVLLFSGSTWGAFLAAVKGVR